MADSEGPARIDVLRRKTSLMRPIHSWHNTDAQQKCWRLELVDMRIVTEWIETSIQRIQRQSTLSVIVYYTRAAYPLMGVVRGTTRPVGHQFSQDVNIPTVKRDELTTFAWFHVSYCLRLQAYIMHLKSGYVRTFVTPLHLTIDRTAYTLSLIHIWRCRRIERCRSRWSPYH